MTRILVVEDEPTIALGLEDDLRIEGWHVEVIGDGATAARRARETAFDLILLDVMLPGKDGFEVCRDLRKAGLRTPIIMLTAKTQENSRFELYNGPNADRTHVRRRHLSGRMRPRTDHPRRTAAHRRPRSKESQP